MRVTGKGMFFEVRVFRAGRAHNMTGIWVYNFLKNGDNLCRFENVTAVE